MFEQSMVVSQVGRVSAGERWTWAGSVAMQVCAALLLIVMPLLHPERMVFRGTAPRALVPLRVVKIPEAVQKRVEAASSSTPAVATFAEAQRSTNVTARIPHGIPTGDAPPVNMTGGFTGMGMGLPDEIAKTGGSPAVRISTRAEVHGPLRVSSGIGAGMLMTPIRPVYPAIAKAAHVEGTVVVAAVISADGRIERARVLSGPAMLAGAALEAVETARYTPYRLNGTVVEVETTVTVNFRMGG